MHHWESLLPFFLLWPVSPSSALWGHTDQDRASSSGPRGTWAALGYLLGLLQAVLLRPHPGQALQALLSLDTFSGDTPWASSSRSGSLSGVRCSAQKPCPPPPLTGELPMAQCRPTGKRAFQEGPGQTAGRLSQRACSHYSYGPCMGGEKRRGSEI